METWEFVEKFEQPGSEYRGKPFWSWNGELKKEELLRQIHVMKEMGFGGYFMHSRTGLITEYLGQEWFELINAGADEGERLGMEAWLYDEDRWPSGSAGGMVTENPEYRMKSLVVSEMAPSVLAESPDLLKMPAVMAGQKVSTVPMEGWELIAVFAAKIDGINVSVYEKAEPEHMAAVLERLAREHETEPGEWKILVFSIVPDACNSNYNGNTYIDTMNREAVERFMELTHEQYRKHCGARLGTSIRGIFTDEPHRGKGMGDLKTENGITTCSVAWTDDLFEEFLARYGYDAREVLPELFYRPGGEKLAPVKHDYFDLTDNLFLERFAAPISRWCRENGMLFTGHVLHEDSLTSQAAPHGSLMRFYPYMDYPGVDVLGQSNTCYWTVKQLTSAARQTGKKWLLSELYGCTGWDLSMKGHKAEGDWQTLLGINLRCPHLSWYTMEGEAKRDYPASILHQSPWYPYYNGVESYFARFGVLMTEGNPLCDVLVLNPVESAWSQCYLGWADWIFARSPEVRKLEEHYETLCRILLGNQIDYDYGEEQMMASMYRVERSRTGEALLRVGQTAYRVVLVSGMNTIRSTTLNILKEFLQAGGKVVFAGAAPEYMDARHSDEPVALAGQAVRVPFSEEAIVEAVRRYSGIYASLRRADGTPEREVFLQMRDYGFGRGVAVLNTNREEEKKDLLLYCRAGAAGHCQCWEMETGSRLDADGLLSREGDCLVLKFSLPAAGTRAFVLTEEKEEGLKPLPVEEKKLEEIAVTGSFPYLLSEENVCVLDIVRWRWADGPWSEEQEILKADMAVRDSLGLEHRGGEMLQPWFEKKKGLASYGELELEYGFYIEDLPEGRVILAGERPERMSYAVNGIPLKQTEPPEIWIDDCFKRMELPAGILKVGYNTISVKTAYTNLTNPEAVYLLGSFGARIDGHRCFLTKPPQKLGYGNLSEYGLPFYTGEVTYVLNAGDYEAIGPLGEGERVVLSPESFAGSMMKVLAAGQETYLYWEPFEADVTEAVARGEAIWVTVVGHRRNLFGPLHLLPRTGKSYGPMHYVTTGENWSEDYALVDSGLNGIVLKKKQA